MSLEDPFFVVKDEVTKAITKTKGLYQRWCELLEDPNAVSKEEFDWTTNELRNSLRSIDWDLEDLEETISIVEKNPKKFKIDSTEIVDRRTFVDRTRQSVKDMRDHMLSPSASSRLDKKLRQSLLSSSSPRRPPLDRYQRLENEADHSNQLYIEDSQQQQQLMLDGQDDTLEKVGGSVGVLKNMGKQINHELDEQAVMLDEFSHEMDNTESRMDNVSKKLAKVLHMSNDRRQWIAILVLTAIMIIVIILFFTI